MNDETTPDTSEIRRLLIDNLRRSGIGLLFLYVLALALSMLLTVSMLNHSARQLGRTLRNELLVGNNAYATKIIDQNLQGQFERIDFQRNNRLLFSLHSQEPGPAYLMHTFEHPICLNLHQESCASALIFRYSLARHFLVITLMALVMLLFSLVSFLLFRQRLLRVFRQTLQAQKEAALGRLSAQVCHDLKLPSLIFQKIAQVESWQEFNGLRPQLQEHLYRLFSMIDKLKRLDLEGIIRPEPFTFARENLQLFLGSLLQRGKLLQLNMPETLQLVADRDKLERILANLVLNAEQSGAAEIQVECRVVASDLLLRVINNGPEIPSAIASRFMDRSSSSRVSSGLGLTMVRDIVLGHGGSCRLDSTAKRTVFELFFPQAVQAFASDQADREPVIEETVQPRDIIELRQPCLWIDPGLGLSFEDVLTPQQQAYFLISSDTEKLKNSILIISNSADVIAEAIESKIPAFFHHSSMGSEIFRLKLQARLKLLMPGSTQGSIA